MIHVCQDDAAPIGRPPAVREKVLACLQSLKRARVSRVIEETGLGESSVRSVLSRAYKDGDVKRYVAEGTQGPFYIYEVKT